MNLLTNKYVCFFKALCILNLLVMHYTIIMTCDVEKPMVPVDYVDNFCFVTIEVVLLVLLFTLASLGRLRIGAFLTTVVTCLWAFSNIVYSRFFFQYIPYSAFSESNSLADPVVVRSLIDGFRWGDLYFALSLVLAIVLYRKIPDMRLKLKSLKYCVVGILSVILLGLASHWVLKPTFSMKAYVEDINYELFRTWRYTCQPVYTNFQRGSMRCMAFAFIEEKFGTHKLTEEKKLEIKHEINRLKPMQVSGHHANSEIKNVIILLVESYMSFSVDMKIDNQEVTPFLNSLARDSSVYYNGHMTSNIQGGESSDGQLIYMMGLLPLRCQISITKAKRNTMPALPAILKRQRGMQTRMVIPTAAAMWSQDAMCKAYGIEKLYSRNDYPKSHGSFLSDEQVMALADSVDSQSSQPFFSTVLTFSMHKPYIENIDNEFTATVGVEPSEFGYYLNACHYTDNQIKRYFDSLKAKGLYDSSLIVIVADHHVSENQLELPPIINERELPVFIINGGFSNDEAWHGQCNQLDVFTTILDILNIDSEWRGLGHTLLNPHYKNSLTEAGYNYSEWIILSDYFKN
ncbi:LTA synthase family protein [Prevotella sp. FD3004]|uniref:LTA synthase family protein n=1 Tax=Prevotella sp. FD3004 TaxID=1408309 RepID=UPI00056375D1|nr:LTA synthase family protein [Prevotella sp. FD3004]